MSHDFSIQPISNFSIDQINKIIKVQNHRKTPGQEKILVEL